MRQTPTISPPWIVLHPSRNQHKEQLVREIPECGGRSLLFRDCTLDERVSSKITYNIVQEDCAHLPAEVLVVRVTHVETLGGEGVGLNLHIGSRDLVDKAGLANVRETYDDT